MFGLGGTNKVRDETTVFIAGPLSLTSLHNIEFYKRFASQVVVFRWGNAHSQREVNNWKRDIEADSDPLKFLYKYYGDDPAVKIIHYPDPALTKSHDILYRTEVIKDYYTWYFQVKGIYEALKQIQTKYTIRTRADEFVEDLFPLINRFLEDKSKLVCGNIFFKNPAHADGAAGFHVGDHIFMGKTNTLLKTYEMICGNYDKVIENHSLEPVEIPAWIDFSSEAIGKHIRNAENILGIGWLKASTELDPLEIIHMHPHERWKLLIKWFDVVDVNEMGMYCFRWQGERKTYDPRTPFFHPVCLMELPKSMHGFEGHPEAWNSFTMMDHPRPKQLDGGSKAMVAEATSSDAVHEWRKKKTQQSGEELEESGEELESEQGKYLHGWRKERDETEKIFQQPLPKEEGKPRRTPGRAINESGSRKRRHPRFPNGPYFQNPNIKIEKKK